MSRLQGSRRDTSGPAARFSFGVEAPVVARDRTVRSSTRGPVRGAPSSSRRRRWAPRTMVPAVPPGPGTPRSSGAAGAIGSLTPAVRRTIRSRSPVGLGARSRSSEPRPRGTTRRLFSPARDCWSGGDSATSGLDAPTVATARPTILSATFGCRCRRPGRLSAASLRALRGPVGISSSGGETVAATCWGTGLVPPHDSIAGLHWRRGERPALAATCGAVGRGASSSSGAARPTARPG